MRSPRFWFLTALAGFAALSRLAPHPPNFSAMVAIALFGGATFEGRGWAALVSFGALLASDSLLQLTYLAGWQPQWGFYREQWAVYACVLASLLVGFLLRRRRNAGTLVAATLASSLLLFLVTNFAVWASGSEASYAGTAGGLLLCYERALPFFRNSLAGDLFYTTALFGGLALAEARFRELRRTHAVGAA